MLANIKTGARLHYTKHPIDRMHISIENKNNRTKVVERTGNRKQKTSLPSKETHSKRTSENKMRTPRTKDASCNADFKNLGSSLRSSGIKSEPAM